MSFILYGVIAAAVVATLITVAVVSYRIGMSRGVGEIFHLRMEAAQARRRMHDLTREAFMAIVDAGSHEGQRDVMDMTLLELIDDIQRSLHVFMCNADGYDIEVGRVLQVAVRDLEALRADVGTRAAALAPRRGCYVSSETSLFVARRGDEGDLDDAPGRGRGLCRLAAAPPAAGPVGDHRGLCSLSTAGSCEGRL